MQSKHAENIQNLRPKVADFKESNKIDPTAGWIPFVLVIAVVPLFLMAIIIAGYFFVA